MGIFKIAEKQNKEELEKELKRQENIQKFKKQGGKETVMEKLMREKEERNKKQEQPTPIPGNLSFINSSKLNQSSSQSHKAKEEDEELKKKIAMLDLEIEAERKEKETKEQFKPIFTNSRKEKINLTEKVVRDEKEEEERLRKIKELSLEEEVEEKSQKFVFFNSKKQTHVSNHSSTQSSEDENDELKFANFAKINKK